MLKSLHIHNYAIIDEINIDFSAKLNVITGETGAGKSILMGALSLILGDRADTSVLSDRDKKCIVEGIFIVEKNMQLKALLKNSDLDDGENGEVVIRREIAPNGKSRAFVNDTPVNLELLKQISSQLVDLHRQFDTLSLSDAAFKRNVIDALADNHSRLLAYQQVFRKWRTTREKLNELQSQKATFDKEFDYNKFLFDELDEAGFHTNELEDADAELKVLGHAETIKSGLAQAYESMSSGDRPLVQQLKSIGHHLGSYEKYHSGLSEILKRIHSAQIELQDISDEIERLNDAVSHDPVRIEELNERITTGYKLLKKHGVQTTAELLTIHQNLENKLQAVMNIDESISSEEKEEQLLLKQVNEMAAELTEKRNKEVKPLQDKVNKLLAQVGMPNARLKVSIEDKAADHFGKDQVEFLFDGNKSNRFEAVGKVASGGELSRLMLSVKSLVAESMDMPTLIFDEIDTGISGEAARQVGIIMQKMAGSRQIITITHQPQIAGKADAHLFVYKDMKDNAVKTNIRTLMGDERITAIAKMLGGEQPTAAALENAKEMVAVQ